MTIDELKVAVAAGPVEVAPGVKIARFDTDTYRIDLPDGSTHRAALGASAEHVAAILAEPDATRYDRALAIARNYPDALAP